MFNKKINFVILSLYYAYEYKNIPTSIIDRYATYKTYFIRDYLKNHRYKYTVKANVDNISIDDRILNYINNKWHVRILDEQEP